MNYTFPRENLVLVTDHLNALDITVVALTLSADIYHLTVSAPVPDEQLEHLGLTAE